MGETRSIDPNVDAIVIALCADFRRRSKALSEGGISHKVEMEYKYLNYKMLSAAGEVVDAEDAQTYIEEIGGRIGYAHTSTSECCERVYKTRKMQIKHNIAKKLFLAD